MSDEWTERVQHLLAEAEAGHSVALGKLLDLFRNYLLAIAAEEIPEDLRPKVNPSDVVQETFLEAWRIFDRFRGTQPGELRVWLRGILLNKLRDLHKHYFGTQSRQVGQEQSLDASHQGQALAR